MLNIIVHHTVKDPEAYDQVLILQRKSFQNLMEEYVLWDSLVAHVDLDYLHNIK